MKKKVCTQCKKEKSLREFYKDLRYSNPYKNKTKTESVCKKCRAEKQRELFKKPEAIKRKREWDRKYRQEHREQIRENSRKYHNSPKGYYISLRKREEVHCTRDEFVEWYEKQPKACCYCGIPEKSLSIIADIGLKGNHLRRLSIDRKVPEKGYRLFNMCLSCILCNMIKGNWFSTEEMKKIATDFLVSKWKAKVNEQK